MPTNRPELWRSRWAAIGAAVAVTLGAGGLATTFAASAASSFVAISPVRVLDTRLAEMGPTLTSNTPRLLDVTGSIPTVGPDGTTVAAAIVVPEGATAIVANVTAVTPSTAGFVAVRPGTTTGNPTTSSVNFTTGGVVVPNSVTVEVPTSGPATGNIQLWFTGLDITATTHLLIDIVGYYRAGDVGPAGPRGDAGPSGLNAWDEIPSATTVTGVFTMYEPSAGGGELFSFGVSFPGRAPAPLGSDDVKVASDSVECTGTAAAPTAPAGMVCLYVHESGNVGSFEGSPADVLPDHGFVVYWFTSAPGDTWVTASWAYTAP